MRGKAKNGFILRKAFSNVLATLRIAQNSERKSVVAIISGVEKRHTKQPQTARTAGRSDRAGAIKRRLFLPAFFSLSNPRRISPAKAGPNLPKTSWWRRYPTLPLKRPHSGPQGRTAGKPPFSLFSIAIFNMPVYISWPHYSRKL